MADQLGQDEGIAAYHGSPHDFDQFDLSRIGSGQGEQAYGHGLYFASAEDLAKSYRDDLSSNRQMLDDRPVADLAREGLMAREATPDQEIARFVNQYGRTARNVMAVNAPHLVDRYDELIGGERLKPAGKMYEVRINAHPDNIMDWDRPIFDQPNIMKMLQDQHDNLDPEHEKFQFLDFAHKSLMNEKSNGSHAHYYLKQVLGSKGASDYLNGMGIKGIKYLDTGSRGVGEGTQNYVIFDDSLVNVARKYRRGGSVNGYADGGEVDPTSDIPQIDNAVSVFPKPQRMFPEDAPVPGGMYLNAATKEDMTGHKAATASIGVQPGGKPYFRASPDSVDETGTPGRGSAIAKTNLFKQKAGWKWAQAPEGHETTNTIVSVEHRGQHHYALNAHFPKGVDLARYENSPTEPRLRPTTRGNVAFGPQVGSILVRGREHPVYEHVIVKNRGGAVDGYADGGGVLPPGHPQRDLNFQNWFGESKVRRRPTSSRDKGPFEPLTVYHGSPKEFSRFNAIGNGVVSHTFGRYEIPRHGMFFAEDPSFASSFAEANAGKGMRGAQVYPVHLSIKNPLWATSQGLDDEDVEKLAAVGVDRNWLTRYAGDPRTMWEQFDGDNGKFFTDALKAAGYDGVHMEEQDPETGEDKRVWVALHPTQIKSATGNQGTFDPSDPDITKASGGPAIAKLRQMSDPAVKEAIRVINKSGSSPRDAVTLSKRLLGRQ